MADSLHVRALLRADLPGVSSVLDDTGLFPTELLPEMAEPFLSGSADHLWLVICEGEAVLGFAYVEPERMTDNTHNLLAIAVSPARQNGGVGKALIEAVERRLADTGGRVLLVETSSLADFEPARAFYDGLGFAREACIREFYAAGEDKIVFWKRL
jgi:ribosomal protein S18 acetylase RimI-like enzyme